MNIELKHIAVKEIVVNYKNDAVEGVFGYDNKLNIRPRYQREFVYKDKQREDVINTVKQNFPLGIIYWVENIDGTYEVLDGQQRIISICSYVAGNFSINFQYFHNLEKEEQNQILDYKLNIYFCKGQNKEKLDWFKVINIAGEKLTNQELRNAIYTGTWLESSKKYFSKPNCPAYDIAKNYLKGSAIRQSYLETVLNWISTNNIEEYMANNQNKPNANALWLYFDSVISWVKTVFKEYRKEMKGIPWGLLYNDFGKMEFDSEKIEVEIAKLMQDEDVSKKSGIYLYIITKDEKYLNIRVFTPNQRREVFEKQNGICSKCGKHFELNEMEADHITPWSKGGKTITENCQMLCNNCNRIKADK